MKMMTQKKLVLSILVCSVISLLQVQAQKTSLPNFLIGEWIYKGPDNPKINDTITLTKVVLNKADYTKWVFEVPNKFSDIHYFDLKKSGVADASASKTPTSEWYFDNSSNLLRISNAKTDKIYKIVYNRNQVLKMIYLK